MLGLAVALLATTTATAAAPDAVGAKEKKEAVEAEDKSDEEKAKEDEENNQDEEKTKEDGKKKGGIPVTAEYKDGLRIKSEDGNFAARIRWRAQSRFTAVDSDELFGEEDGVDEEAGFRIRRSRFKLDGHAYRPWLKYYLEYGISGGFLLTLQLELQKHDEFGVRLGQYKVPYNRERVDSSGKQQFADRSVVNRNFTIDRQSGVNFQGHLFAGTRGDSKYDFGFYTGTGRGGDLEDDEDPMYVGRWQWNFLKRNLPYSQSDIKGRDPAASLAVAAASNIGRFTRWSSSGAGQLPGFEDAGPGEDERYKTEQWMAEFAYQGRGLSLQSEYHFKQVDDRVDNIETELDGYYAQVGYFFHEAFPSFPKKLEFAFRVAEVNSKEGVVIPEEEEKTFAVNWFFHGHNNKLTFDVTRLETTLPTGSDDDGWRGRVQWDITF